MDVIRKSLFGEDRKSSYWFVNFVNAANGGTAMLQCAQNYAKSVEKSARDGFPAKKLSENSKYFFYILKYLLSIGSRVNDKDANRSNLVHYLLRPISEMKHITMTQPLDDVGYVRFGCLATLLALFWIMHLRRVPVSFCQLVENFMTIWNLYKDRAGGFKPETLNVYDGNERTPICYVVQMHEHPNREEIIMMLLNKGTK